MQRIFPQIYKITRICVVDVGQCPVDIPQAVCGVPVDCLTLSDVPCTSFLFRFTAKISACVIVRKSGGKISACVIVRKSGGKISVCVIVRKSGGKISVCVIVRKNGDSNLLLEHMAPVIDC
jgi:hypothetical protein